MNRLARFLNNRRMLYTKGVGSDTGLSRGSPTEISALSVDESGHTVRVTLNTCIVGPLFDTEAVGEVGAGGDDATVIGEDFSGLAVVEGSADGVADMGELAHADLGGGVRFRIMLQREGGSSCFRQYAHQPIRLGRL